MWKHIIITIMRYSVLQLHADMQDYASVSLAAFVFFITIPFHRHSFALPFRAMRIMPSLLLFNLSNTNCASQQWHSCSTMEFLLPPLSSLSKKVYTSSVHRGHKPFIATLRCRVWLTRFELVLVINNPNRTPVTRAIDTSLLALWSSSMPKAEELNTKKPVAVIPTYTAINARIMDGSSTHFCSSFVFDNCFFSSTNRSSPFALIDSIERRRFFVDIREAFASNVSLLVWCNFSSAKRRLSRRWTKTRPKAADDDMMSTLLQKRKEKNGEEKKGKKRKKKNKMRFSSIVSQSRVLKNWRSS